MWQNPLLEFVGWMNNSSELGSVAAGLQLFCVLFSSLNTDKGIIKIIPGLMSALFQMFASPDVKYLII